MASALSAADALWIWECGQDRHPVDRALLILAVSGDGASMDELSRLSIGQRDAALLDLRIATLGERLDMAADCPHCGIPVEVTLPAGTLRVPGQAAGPAPVIDLECEDRRLRLRPPDSRDLARIATLPSNSDPRRALLQACVGVPEDEARAVDIEALPEPVLQDLSSRLAAADPQADIVLDLRCEACGGRWPLQFDIASFFWEELAALAQRLLREVDALARAYGWREADILAMSPARRRLYLEMVG